MEEQPTQQIPCPKCQFPILTSFNFCPNCGVKFHEPPFSMSLGAKIGLYAVSILLPPFGLWPGLKLLFKNDRKAQVAGIIAILLTALSTLVAVWITYNFINTQLNSTLQLDQYQNLGL